MDVNSTTTDSIFEQAAMMSPLPQSVNMAIGIYLVVVGTLGTMGNTVVLTAFFRFKHLKTRSTYILISLAVADLGICIFGYPFSSASSFAGGWLFGPTGCQWYAFLGFFFGSAHIGSLTILAVDRYQNAHDENLSQKSGSRGYIGVISGAWIYALFWSVMPLLGWARYGLEPSLTTCTIDWRHNDWSYKSFLVAYFILGYVIPIVVIVYCYTRALQTIKDRQGMFASRGTHPNENWASEKNATWMTLAIVAAFLFAWSPYAILCMWTVFANPQTVPPFLTLIPPLFAKASTVFNPVIYYLSNRVLRASMLAALCCHSQPTNREALMELPQSPEKIPMHSDSL